MNKQSLCEFLEEKINAYKDQPLIKDVDDLAEFLKKELLYCGKVELTEQQVIEKCLEITKLDYKYVSGLLENEIKDGNITYVLTISIDDLIFNHDVAKSLFLEEDVCYCCGTFVLNRKRSGCPDCPDQHVALTAPGFNPCWEYHLQQIAIAEDRIQYLREWLKK